MFARVLVELKSRGFNFCVSMLGKACLDFPETLTRAKEELGDKVLHWGYVESKEEYISILHRADVVVSTAKHEFFGVAMYVKFSYYQNFLNLTFLFRMEAVICGCYPLCPDDIVYPEIYPKACLYKNQEDLISRLSHFCQFPKNAGSQYKSLNFDFDRFSDVNLLPEYKKTFYFDPWALMDILLTKFLLLCFSTHQTTFPEVLSSFHSMKLNKNKSFLKLACSVFLNIQYTGAEVQLNPVISLLAIICKKNKSS